MSSFSGPNIVKDGLILYQDYDNLKCYPGSGLTSYDLTNKSTNATFSTLTISQNALDCNTSSSSTITFPEVPYTNWSLFYAFKPTGTPISNYRSVIFTRDVNGVTYFISDTREIASPSILHYIKDFNINSWWTRQMLSGAEYATYPWRIYGCSQNGTQIKNYINGNLTYTDTITQSLTGYGNLNRLVINGNSGNVVNLSFICIYNKILTDDEMKQNFNALRGRFEL